MYFNDNIAKKYGFAEAIILQSIYNWCLYNQRNKKNNFDGMYWMFNTNKEFLEELPYLKNINTIRTALKTLKDEGLILTGNYNNTCTRTTWYSVTQKALDEMMISNVSNEPNIQSESVSASMQDVPEQARDNEPEQPVIINSEIRIDENSNTYVKKQQLILQNPAIRIAENNNTYLQNQQLILLNPAIRIAENSNLTNNITTINNKNIIEKEINKEKEEKTELDNVCLSIFDHWNNANILRCLDLTPRLKGIIRYALKFFTEQEIKTCIDRYDTVYHDKSYFYSYPCSLKSFLTKSNAMKDFTDNGDKWRAYNKWKQGNTAPDEFIHNNYTKEQIESLLTDLDNVDV